MLMQIQYAYLNSSLWGPSVLAAVDIHNTGPIMDTARPALKHTPASASAPELAGRTTCELEADKLWTKNEERHRK